MKKVMVVFGTRPEAIKLAPVIRELRRHQDRVTARICVTAQHREMLDSVLQLFGIRADRDLNLMRPHHSLAGFSALAMKALDRVVQQEKPDFVLVQGDTSTAFISALISFYHRCPVGHVEAGLRSGDKWAPFPEEINRCLISRLADLHFAATRNNAKKLLQEGIDKRQIWITGNPVIDALRWAQEIVIKAPPSLPHRLARALSAHRLILVTGHRRENFGAGLQNICEALTVIADARPDVIIVYPVHLNPSVRDPVFKCLGRHPRIYLLEPLAYGVFVRLMSQAEVVLTDSGGIQEEAPALGKPVLVMREVTERQEGIECGVAKLVGTNVDRIVSNTLRLLDDSGLRKKMARAVLPYGDGRASERIVAAILKYLR